MEYGKIQLLVNGQYLIARFGNLVSGSQNYLSIGAYFSSDWDNMVKTVYIVQNRNPIFSGVLDSTNTIQNTANITLNPGIFQVYIIGLLYDALGNIVEKITTNACDIVVIPGGV